jgi:hypothetical protein
MGREKAIERGMPPQDLATCGDFGPLLLQRLSDVCSGMHHDDRLRLLRMSRGDAEQ